MSDFHIGQKVVCVDAAECPPFDISHPTCLVEGQVYTIRYVAVERFIGERGYIEEVAVKVVGVQRPTIMGDAGDLGLAAWRFRPLEETSKTIEQFREIARGVSDGKPIIEDAEWRAPTPEKVKA